MMPLCNMCETISKWITNNSSPNILKENELLKLIKTSHLINTANSLENFRKHSGEL